MSLTKVKDFNYISPQKAFPFGIAFNLRVGIRVSLRDTHFLYLIINIIHSIYLCW